MMRFERLERNERAKRKESNHRKADERGKRNASTETGICAELVNTVLPVQEVVATISYILETSVDVIRKCATSMRKESENET